MISLEELKKHSDMLHDCPYCSGKAWFATNKSDQIVLTHFPSSGVICPARYEQICESFEIGISWWNTRNGRIHYEVAGK